MTTAIARILVNDIEVGTMPAETYLAIVSSVRKDVRLYLAYAGAFVGSVLHMLGKFYLSMPTVVAGLLLLLAMVSPDSFTDLVTELKAASPETITEALRSLIGNISVFFLVAAPLLSLVFPAYFRFQSPFDKALSHQVRSLMEVPSDGPIKVIMETPIQ